MNDLEPIQQSPVGDFLERFNLPHIIAGPAGKAISRLIGGAVDIPAAKLEQFSQAIRDKTAAKTTVSKSLAKAVADHVVSDPDLIDRAAQSLLTKELRKQHNKEHVAVKAIEHLKQHDHETNNSASGVDEDWLNVFERYAEDASTERLQDLWGKVLAGEIHTSGSFSLKTLRFISELDVSVANTFERIASEVLLRSFIPTAEMSMSGQRLADFLQLEEFGLIADHRAQLERRIRVPVARFVLPYYDHGVCLHSDASTKSPIEFKIRGIALTQVGREIYQILSPAFDVENAKTLTEQIPRERLSEISYGQYVHKADGVITYFQTQSLWKAKD